MRNVILAISATLIVSLLGHFITGNYGEAGNLVSSDVAGVVFGTQVGDPVVVEEGGDPGGDPEPGPHKAYELMGSMVCVETDMSDCQYCVGTNYTQCAGATQCGTKNKENFFTMRGAGDYDFKKKPTFTYCSKKWCDDENVERYVYCGESTAKVTHQCGY